MRRDLSGAEDLRSGLMPVRWETRPSPRDLDSLWRRSGSRFRSGPARQARRDCMDKSGLQPMEDDDAPPAIDWLGNPVSCRDCPHEENRVSGLCDLGRACVRDLRARRIDRFFSINPGLADSYLDHPFFEVRSIAARYASPFRLLPLLSDVEPDVRAMAAIRLPASRVLALRSDPDRRVRIALARRLTGEDLVPLLGDPDYQVRLSAARSASDALLVGLLDDPEPDIRREAARRVPLKHLPALVVDPEPLVRIEIARRLEPARLHLLAADPDFRVRYAVAERIATDELPPFLQDEDEAVRELAQERTKDREG